MLDNHNKNSHQELSHIDEKVTTHQCQFCPKRFSHAGQLIVHVENVHMKIKPHKCKFCEKQFGMKSTLKIHVLKNHNDIDNEETKSHECTFCKKRFAIKGLLQSHVKSFAIRHYQAQMN